jgi:hypothetical protein
VTKARDDEERTNTKQSKDAQMQREWKTRSHGKPEINLRHSGSSYFQITNNFTSEKSLIGKCTQQIISNCLGDRNEVIDLKKLLGIAMDPC